MNVTTAGVICMGPSQVTSSYNPRYIQSYLSLSLSLSLSLHTAYILTASFSIGCPEIEQARGRRITGNWRNTMVGEQRL